MKFRTFFVCLVSVGAAWMFSGCDGEENSLADTFTDSSPQQGFSWEGFKDPFLAAQLIVNWEHPREVETFPEELHATPGGKRVYEYPVSFKGKGLLEQGSKKLYFRYRMLAYDNNDGVWSYTLVKYLSADQKSLAEVGYEQKAEFSGTVTYYPIDGAPTRLEAYEKGVLLDTRTDEVTGNSTALKEAPIGCEGGCWVEVPVYVIVDYYISINGGPFTYSYSIIQSVYYQSVWISGSGGTSGGEIPAFYHEHHDDPHGPSVGSFNHSNEDILDAPPSCESFNFQSLGTLNFMYSYVRGIRFLVINQNGDRFYIKYSNPMEFGAPKTDRFGNEFRPGYLAEISARALEEAMDYTFKYIRSNPWINTDEAKRIFEAELKRVYPLHIPGGRVTIRPTHQYVSLVTEYVATWFGNGNCD